LKEMKEGRKENQLDGRPQILCPQENINVLSDLID
jgi:hypothetical protein